MTEKEKMITGLAYQTNDPQLVELRATVRKKLGPYNQVGIHKTDDQLQMLKNILGKMGDGSWIEPPFYCV